jgi:hypothetical protein
MSASRLWVVGFLLVGNLLWGRVVQADWRTEIRKQAAQHGWQVFNAAYLKATVRALNTLDATQPHAAFIFSREIDLEVVPPGPAVPESSLGTYHDDKRKMFLNEHVLLRGMRELRDKGATDEEIPEILAWKMMPTIAHEIRHAMTAEGVRQASGVSPPFKPLESEFISFLEEIVVILEIIRVRPGLWSDSSRILEIENGTAALLRARKRHPVVLKESIAATGSYRKRHRILDTPRAELVERYQNELADYKRYFANLETAPDSFADPAEAEELEHVAMQSVRSLGHVRKMHELYSDAEVFNRIHAFYATEIQRVERRLRKSRKP